MVLMRGAGVKAETLQIVIIYFLVQKHFNIVTVSTVTPVCTSQTRGLPVCVHLHGGGRKSCVYRLLLEELGSALPSDGYSKSCSTVNSKWRGETSTLSWETEDPWDVGFFLKLGMGWLLLSLVHPSFLSKTPSPKHEHTESSPTQRKCPTLQYSFQNLRF